jgi:hypothetical protein
MKSAINRKMILGVVILLIGSLSCTLTQSVSTQPPAPESANATTSTVPPTSTESNTTTISGPGGMVLTLEGNALTDNGEIQLEVLGSGEFAWETTPFQVASLEYLVGFGAAEQVGGITLTVPLGTSSSSASRLAAPALTYAYAAWSQPDKGSPSLVGVITAQDQATFPVVGAGKYQVLKIPSYEALAEMVDVKDPLSVPSYPQMTPAWCSPTALTDLAGYHEGAWAGADLGSIWGESSNWYLAGKAGQAYNSGYFFHWLLHAGGYDVPENVKESFTNGNAEVIIWNWKSAKIDPFILDFFDIFPGLVQSYVSGQVEYATELFDFFHAYVESNVWGQNGSRRPVAWGSSLAGHSRTITGSDGTNLYYNDPGSGAWNQTKSWAAYLQEVINSLSAEKTEVIDTVAFYADPRPDSERHAVLWLLQKSDSQNGSIILRRGTGGDPEAYWIWDGALSHELGYYYQDLMGELPLDDTLDVKFKAFTVFDKVDYGYSIRSISEGSYNYLVHTEVYTSRGGKVPFNLPDQTATVGAGQRIDFFPAGSFPIVDLKEYLYYLKFTLSQDGIVQDVKYVYFWIAPTNVAHIPMASALSAAYCRQGPGQNYEIVTTLEAGQELHLMGLSPDMNWGKFEATLSGNTVRCWVGLLMVDLRGFNDVPILEIPPVPTCNQYTNQTTCDQHPECKWSFRTAGPAVCQAK